MPCHPSLQIFPDTFYEDRLGLSFCSSQQVSECARVVSDTEYNSIQNLSSHGTQCLEQGLLRSCCGKGQMQGQRRN